MTLSIIEQQGGKNTWTPKVQAIFLAEKLGMTDYANHIRKKNFWYDSNCSIKRIRIRILN